jgi:Tfp pilus assembly protein PilF
MAVSLARDSLWHVFEELSLKGARPEELASLADDQNRFDVCRALLARGMISVAKETVFAAVDRQSLDFDLVRSSIALAENDLVEAREASQRAIRVAPGDPRAVLAAAEVEEKTRNVNAALTIVRNGLRFAPASVDLNRKLVTLAMSTDRWDGIDRALEGLRAALVQSGLPSSEANIASAHVFERRGQYRRAASEYRTALFQHPNNIGLLLSLARAEEDAGNLLAAEDACADVLRIAPENSDAKAALARLSQRRGQRLLEAIGIPPAHTGGN